MNSHHHLQAGAARSVALHHCRPTQLLLLLKAPHNQRSSLPRAHAFSGGEPHDAHDPSIIKTSTSNTPDGPAGKSGPGALPGAAATPLTHMQLLQQLFHSALATPPQLALPAPAGVSQMLTNYFHFIPSPNGAPDGNLLQPASKGSASTTQQQLASTPGSANNTGRSGSTRPARSALETIQEGTAAAAQSWTSLRLSVLMVWHRAHIASGPVTRELSNRLSASQSFAERVWLALVWQAGAAAIVMLAALNHGVHTLPPALLTSTLQAQYIARMAALVAQEAAAKSVVHATAATPLHFSVVENQKKRFIEAALPLQALLLDLEQRCPTHTTLQFMLRQLQPETRMQTLLLMQKALHRARQLSHLQHQADAWVAEWSASPPQAYDLATRRTVSSPPAAAAEGFSPETRAAAPTSGAADADGADTNQPTAAAAAPAPAPSPLLRRGPAGAKAGARGAWWDSTVVGELESAVTAFSTHQADLRHVCRLIWVLEAGLAEADHKP